MNRKLYRALEWVCVLLPLLTCSAGLRAEPPQSAPSSLEIEVHREGGFFPNPTYTLTIFGDGRVRYLGIANVHWKGQRSSRISRDEVGKLVELVDTSGFFALQDSFHNGSCQEHDQATSTLRVRLGEQRKSVGSCGAPDAVQEIMAAAEKAAHAARWTFFDPRELQLKIDHGWDIKDQMPKFMEDAIRWQDGEIIEVLVKNGVDVNGVNSDHEHFLMGAVRGGDVESARVLLNLGADWKIEEDYGGESPAINAGYRTPEMLKLFLDKGADINAVSTGGSTMLMNAASQTNPATVKFLVEHGADVNIRNARGETALARAQEYYRKYWHGTTGAAQSSQEISDYLIAHGALASQ